MSTIEVRFQRFSIVSNRPFKEIVKTLTSQIGHPDISAFHRAVSAARTLADLERVVRAAVGSSNLMEFARFDMGDVVGKERIGQRYKALRFIVGNPLIMKEMVKHVPDAAAYAPVTMLVDERDDGVHLSYDLIATLIASCGNEDALAVARDLDSKVMALLQEFAQ
jgi:uncharacterized protein (DUF302 family)